MKIRSKYIIPAVTAGGVLFLSGWLLVSLTPRDRLRKTEDREGRYGTRQYAERGGQARRDDTRATRRRVDPAAVARTMAIYEQALVENPDMRPAYREVPDGKNGYLQLLQRLEDWDPAVLPDDLRKMLESGEGWDTAKLQDWYGKNRNMVDDILAIGSLPDRSIKGIDFDRVFRRETKGAASDIGRLLCGLSRMAAEQGDDAGALRFLRADIQLGQHLSGTEAPSMVARILAEGMRSGAETAFTDHHLGRLAGQPERLREWRDALFPPQDLAGGVRLALVGEWNYLMRSHIAPFLSGEQDAPEEGFSIADAGGFIREYAAGYRSWMAVLDAQEPGRYAVTPLPAMPTGDHLDADSSMALKGLFNGMNGIVEALGNTFRDTAQKVAAISILLGEEPPVDPVSGQPFRWDPATRELFLPMDGDVEEAMLVPGP